MYSILKSTENEKYDFSLSDPAVASFDPNLIDPWLFTDPLAREIYQRQGQLGMLEEDIRNYVMYDDQWLPEDLECKWEIQRLLRVGLITPSSNFGYLSPHPTIYSAQDDGELIIVGQRFCFEVGDDLVFKSWLERIVHPALIGPVWVGQMFQVTIELCLCCDVFPNVYIQCDKTRAIMQQILNYRNNRK